MSTNYFGAGIQTTGSLNKKQPTRRNGSMCKYSRKCQTKRTRSDILSVTMKSGFTFLRELPRHNRHNEESFSSSSTTRAPKNAIAEVGTVFRIRHQITPHSESHQRRRRSREKFLRAATRASTATKLRTRSRLTTPDKNSKVHKLLSG